MPEKPVGKVEHYYPKVQAAAVRLTRKVKLGDKVHIVGHGDDFRETVTSLQLDHEPIQEGRPGQAVGLWVKERVHEGDDVLLVESEAAQAKRPAAKKAAKARGEPERTARRRSKAKAKRPKRAAKAKRSAPSKPRKAARKSGRKRR